MTNSRGFSLIEVLFVVVVLGILTAIAIPYFDNVRNKARRADAVVALTTAVQRQDRWRTKNGTYTSDPTQLTESGTNRSPDGLYIISVANVTAETYSITATATVGQLGDTDCRAFTITHTGKKSVKNASNVDNTSSCWVE